MGKVPHLYEVIKDMMDTPVLALIIIAAVMFSIIALLTVWTDVYSINSIKSK